MHAVPSHQESRAQEEHGEQPPRHWSGAGPGQASPCKFLTPPVICAVEVAGTPRLAPGDRGRHSRSVVSNSFEVSEQVLTEVNMANQMVRLRLTENLTDGQVEKVSEQHPTDHGVRNNEYASSTELGDVS